MPPCGHDHLPLKLVNGLIAWKVGKVLWCRSLVLSSVDGGGASSACPRVLNDLVSGFSSFLMHAFPRLLIIPNWNLDHGRCDN